MKSITLIGASDKPSAYSQVNNQLITHLRDIGIAVKNNLDEANINLTDIVIHHDPEEYFGNIKRPDVKYFIAYRTWDFGPFPKKWVEIINSDCDQLWVYSNWVKNQAIAGGVDPKKVKVLPIGIKNPEINSPKNMFKFKTKKTFKFLFIGATIYRKGIDILLEAYKKSFSKEDDVSLIIKDNPIDVYYKDISFKDEIIDFVNGKDNPEIIYINEYLSENEILSIYQSVDIGVFPYRSEGFARPILELMAAGVPSIVPNFGPCLDYCSEERSIIVPIQRFALPIRQSLEFNTLGFTEEIEEVDFCEMDPNSLAESMYKIFTDKNKINNLSENGKEFANQNYSWEKIIEILVKNINEIKN